MSETHDEELLEQIVEEMAEGKKDDLLILLQELLDQEQQVSHIARPHRILLNIEDMLKKHLEA
jgi:methanogenic corrinoid protein MtbC1